ncbi:MAG: hypothetical protein Tsb0021_11260 [Chlamydiales bacterium]
MAINTRWKLPEELNALSIQQWPQNIVEWKLEYVELLDSDSEFETCLCHHHPIREVCHIRNVENQNTAIVGNCCIKKFGGDTAFKGTHKIFDAFKRIKDDTERSANVELIEYARQQGILTENEQSFYLNIWRKTSLTTRQLERKKQLNERIINVIQKKSDTLEEVQKVAENSLLELVNDLEKSPKRVMDKELFLHVVNKNFLQQKDTLFYVKFIGNDWRPSEKQQEWINDINQRVLTAAKDSKFFNLS